MCTCILYGNFCCNMEMSKMQSRSWWKLGRIEISLEKGSWRCYNNKRDASRYWDLTRHLFYYTNQSISQDFKWSKNDFTPLSIKKERCWVQGLCHSNSNLYTQNGSKLTQPWFLYDVSAFHIALGQMACCYFSFFLICDLPIEIFFFTGFCHIWARCFLIASELKLRTH
jgi:hypothetical protein